VEQPAYSRTTGKVTPRLTLQPRLRYDIHKFNKQLLLGPEPGWTDPESLGIPTASARFRKTDTNKHRAAVGLAWISMATARTSRGAVWAVLWHRIIHVGVCVGLSIRSGHLTSPKTSQNSTYGVGNWQTTSMA